MTEAEWLASTDPDQMLGCVLGKSTFLTSWLRSLAGPTLSPGRGGPTSANFGFMPAPAAGGSRP